MKLGNFARAQGAIVHADIIDLASPVRSVKTRTNPEGGIVLDGGRQVVRLDRVLNRLAVDVYLDPGGFAGSVITHRDVFPLVGPEPWRGNHFYGITRPLVDDVRADLAVNCRNSHAVASLLAQFGGAPAAPGAPEGTPVTLVAVESASKAVEEAQGAVRHLLEDLEIDPSNILVLTGHRDMRDQIRNVAPDGTFVSWEERQSGGVICETIHRSKGLERDAVVVVTEDKDLPHHLLYVGLSRAVSHLVVVAPQELLDRMV